MSIYELENFRVSNLKKLKIVKFLLPLFILVSFYDKHTIGSVNFLYFGVGVAVFTSEMKYKFYILGAYLILYIFLFRLNLPNDFTIIVALNISGLLFYCAVFQTTKHEIQNKFTEHFQNTYLESCVEKFGFEFERYGKIKYGLIWDSKIFKQGYKLHADNKIFGKFNGLDFEFARLFLYDKDKNNPICGAFFHATFDKSINSKFFIVANDAKFSATKNLKKTTTDDSKFDEIFSVYSNDIQNAEYILTPAFMKRVMNLERRLNFPICISIMDKKICIFLDTGEEIFKPNIDKSVLNKNPAFTIKRVVLQCLAITKMLNLNKKIFDS